MCTFSPSSWAYELSALQTQMLAGCFSQGLSVLLTLSCRHGEGGGIDPNRWSSLSESGDLPQYVVVVGKHSPGCGVIKGILKAPLVPQRNDRGQRVIGKLARGNLN